MATTILPRQLGKFRIDGVLGQGAMGVVYLGYDPAIDRPVAVKTIHTRLLADEEVEEYLRRFRQEARAAARCQHPGIVTIYDVGVERDTPFIAMEYCAGQSLKALLARDGRLALAEALAIALQLLEALSYTHARGVVHRDIKPANVLVLPDGSAKLTDFGIAHIEAQAATQIGAVLGTPGYMAPEQRLGQPITAAADLYAVGVVLLEGLIGQRPLPGRLDEVLATLRRGEPVALPPALLSALDRALANAPGARFADAAAMAAALRASEGPAGVGGSVAAGADAAVTRLLGARVAAGMAARQEAGRPTGLTQATAWHPGTLAAVERELAETMGPMARLLVRRHAPGAGDLATLGKRLGTYIDDPLSRAGFLRRVQGLGADSAATRLAAPVASGVGTADRGERQPEGEPGPEPGPGQTRASIDPVLQQGLERSLAQSVGPVARLLLRRAMQQAANLDDLIQQLAAAIPDQAERQRFLASLPPH